MPPMRCRKSHRQRQLPDHAGTEHQALLGRGEADRRPGVEVTPIADFKPSPASPLRPTWSAPTPRSIAKLYGKDVPIIPHMSTGATDGLYFRSIGIPVYGAEGVWGISPDDERAHGLDERIPTRAFYNGIVHWENMLRDLAG